MLLDKSRTRRNKLLTVVAVAEGGLTIYVGISCEYPPDSHTGLQIIYGNWIAIWVACGLNFMRSCTADSLRVANGITAASCANAQVDYSARSHDWYFNCRKLITKQLCEILAGHLILTTRKL